MFVCPFKTFLQLGIEGGGRCVEAQGRTIREVLIWSVLALSAFMWSHSELFFTGWLYGSDLRSSGCSDRICGKYAVIRYMWWEGGLNVEMHFKGNIFPCFILWKVWKKTKQLGGGSIICERAFTLTESLSSIYLVSQMIWLAGVCSAVNSAAPRWWRSFLLHLSSPTSVLSEGYRMQRARQGGGFL